MWTSEWQVFAVGRSCPNYACIAPFGLQAVSIWICFTWWHFKIISIELFGKDEKGKGRCTLHRARCMGDT
jgi:hypothetical protein